MTAVPTSSPCPVCGAAVTYSGRGRRPIYCTPACKRAERAEAARFRRARERDEPEAVADVEARLFSGVLAAPDWRLAIDRAYLSGRADAPITPAQRLAALRAFARLRKHQRAQRPRNTARRTPAERNLGASLVTYEEAAASGYLAETTRESASAPAVTGYATTSRDFARDPAAQWIAEHHGAAALATFERPAYVGATCA